MSISFTLWDFDLEIAVFFVGFYYLVLWTTRYCWLILRTFLGTKCTTERYGKGSWAIVTGGAAGLGREAVMELGQRGFNIIIVGNETSTINQVVQEVKKLNSGIKIETYTLDFGRNYQISDFEAFYNKFKHLDISVLVNNVTFVEGNVF